MSPDKNSPVFMFHVETRKTVLHSPSL